jgi:dihydrofolate reductase
MGIHGKLPWNIPEDRALFKSLTRDNILIIGRKTLEEEPDQCHISHAARCIVLSKSLSDASFEGSSHLQLARSFPEALHQAREYMPHLPPSPDPTDSHAEAHTTIDSDVRCWVAGGENVYHEALLHPSACIMHLTRVDMDVHSPPGEDKASPVSFPAAYRWDNKFELVSTSSPVQSSTSQIVFTHCIYHRIKGRR